MLLHVGGASTASVLVAVTVIFLLIFSMSFAFGPVPEGKRRYSGEWMSAWLKASAPRLAVAFVFSALLFTGSALFGGDNSNGTAGAVSCEQTLSPVTGNEVTTTRVLLAADGMQQIETAATEGDRDRVRTLFFTSDAHNLTHDLDPVLRPLDDSLGRQLCEQVIGLEEQMASDFDNPTVAQLAKDISATLLEAQQIFRGNTTTPGPGTGPCEQPLVSVTDEPLAEGRLNDAIAALRETADLARSGDNESASAKFYNQDAHNISHDIDGPLRQQNLELAIDLCLSILEIERNFGSISYDAEVVATEADRSADLLQQAGEEMRILS